MSYTATGLTRQRPLLSLRGQEAKARRPTFLLQNARTSSQIGLALILIVVYRDELDEADRELLLRADNWQGAHVQAPVWIYWYADIEAAFPDAFVRNTHDLLDVGAIPAAYGWARDTIKAAIQEGVETPEGMASIQEILHNMPPEVSAMMAYSETVGACAVATLAAQFIILWIVRNWTVVTGGVESLFVRDPVIFGWALRTDFSWYWVLTGVAALVVVTSRNLFRTGVGRAFMAIRDQDIAAEAIGVNLTRYKVVAFAVSSAFVGLAGALTAHWTNVVTWERFTLTVSILYLAMIIVGGLGSTLGSVLGAAFMILLPSLLKQGAEGLQGSFLARQLPAIELFAFGLVLCAIRWRRDERSRAVLAVALLSLLLFFGRSTLGPLLRLLPGSGDLFLRRYVFGVHLAGLYLMGIALAWAGRMAFVRLRRFLPEPRAVPGEVLDLRQRFPGRLARRIDLDGALVAVTGSQRDCSANVQRLRVDAYASFIVPYVDRFGGAFIPFRVRAISSTSAHPLALSSAPL